MKNISTLKLPVTAFVIAMLLALSFVPMLANAAVECRVRATIGAGESLDLLGQPRGQVPPGTLPLDTADNSTNSDNALLCTYGLVKWVTNLLFVVILVIATLFIALAAFYFITAGSKPDSVGKARNFLMYAVIGLVVASLAKVIPAIVRGVIGL